MKWRLTGGTLALAALGVFLLAACGSSDSDSAEAVQMGQLRAAYTDTPIDPPMPDHLFMELDDGTLLFLHFDGPVDDAEELWYVGQAVPGAFTAAEQERVNEQFGDGFTHFHQKDCPSDSADACHGGQGGEDGYWFRHIAVDSFTMPWGEVQPGIDHGFMPTSPPQ